MKEYKANKIKITIADYNQKKAKIILKTDVLDLDGYIDEQIDLTFSMDLAQATYQLGVFQEVVKKMHEIADKRDKSIYILNDYLKLKLEDNGKTQIYVNNNPYITCTYLLLNLEVGNSYDEIQSIDEAAQNLGEGMHLDHSIIEAEEEFWGHCSNMQAWVENDYDTRLLRSNLAFRLLKKLVSVGDPKAKRAYKKELALRLESNDLPVTIYLIKTNYLKDLSFEEIEIIIDNMKPGIAKMLLQYRDSREYEFDGYFMRKEGFIITDVEHYLEGYDDYKKAFPLDKLEVYSRRGLGKLIDFGIKWRKFKVMFKESDIKEGSKIFKSDHPVMVQIPRSKANLRLFVEDENMAIYIEPILII